MDNEDKLTVFNIPMKVGFFMRHNKGLNSARMRAVLYNLPKEIAKIQNPTLPRIENVSD